MSSSARPVVGEIYKRELLQSEATYRVVAVDDDHVEVEAVAVPGLPAGFRMRLTADAVTSMVRVADGAPSTEPEPRDDRATSRLRMA